MSMNRFFCVLKNVIFKKKSKYTFNGVFRGKKSDYWTGENGGWSAAKRISLLYGTPQTVF